MRFLGHNSNEFKAFENINHLLTARLSMCWNRDAFESALLHSNFGEPLIIKGKEFYSPNSHTMIIVDPREFTVDVITNSLEFETVDRDASDCPLVFNKGCKILVFSNDDWSLDWLVRAS